METDLMDRTVYKNTTVCSPFSDDSCQSTPPATSGRVKTSREFINENNVFQMRQRQGRESRPNTDRQNHDTFPRFTKQKSQQHHYNSIPNCHTAGAGARHIFHKKTGGSGGGLTRKILHSGISRVAIPCNRDRDEMEFQYGTVLVLHLQCKNIFTMTPGALDPFYNLKNLYLYKNSIRRIQGLDALCSLELLDMSRNNVERIENLDNCTRLKKLFLGFNEIQVMEGLEGLECLEELHIDDQDMPPEQPLIFSPGIMASVAPSLVMLDLSSNQLRSLDPIAELPVLHTLIAADNHFVNFECILETLETLCQLRFLTLKGNPIARKPNYKSKIVGVVYRLEILDDKDVNETTRACVQKLRLIKEYRARQREEAAKINGRRETNEGESNFQSHQIDLENPNEFSFSTPTRLSPLPKVRPAQKPQSDNEESHHSVGNVIDRTTPESYKSRARNSADDDFLMDTVGGDEEQMSDMAKIIFRLSNLDNVGPGGDGGNLVRMRHANYWEVPGSSLPRECRPLSPLEGEIYIGIPPTKPTHSSSTPELVKQVERKTNSGSRPKRAAPGGRQCSNNVNKQEGVVKSQSDFTVAANSVIANQFQAQRHSYGRTLSPLMELPTPESLTARDEQKE